MDAPNSPPLPQQRLPSLVAEAVCLAALVLACVKLGRGVEGVLDLGLWDEADYLHRAFLLPERGLPDPEWGPLYSVWYFALSRVWPDPVDLYYGNTRLLLLLTTVAGYVFLRRVGAKPWLALAGAAVYLLSMAPHVLPRPTLLSVFIILVALGAATSARTPAGACIRVGLGLLIASFARPEYFLSFLLMSLLLGGLLAHGVWRGGWKTRAPWLRALRTGAAYGLAALALVAVMGNPFGNTSNRRFYAFCQHFADNHVRRTGLALNPWGECPKVISQVFGDVDTLGAAARANPGAFLTHLGMNLQRYPRESVRMFAAGYGNHSPLPGPKPWTREQAGHLFLLVVAVGLPLGLLAWNARRLARALRSRRVVETVVAACVVLLPVLASVVLIQPRQHYLVLQGLMVLAVLAALVAAVEPDAPAASPHPPATDSGLTPEPGGLVLAALLAGVLVLSVPDLVRRQGGPDSVTREQLQQVLAIRALGLQARAPRGTPSACSTRRGACPCTWARRSAASPRGRSAGASPSRTTSAASASTWSSWTAGCGRTRSSRVSRRWTPSTRCRAPSGTPPGASLAPTWCWRCRMHGPPTGRHAPPCLAPRLLPSPPCPAATVPCLPWSRAGHRMQARDPVVHACPRPIFRGTEE
ncbi:hypothetical protein ACLESD_40755 [Pyxidicoccus sp. 3LFB2]